MGTYLMPYKGNKATTAFSSLFPLFAQMDRHIVKIMSRFHNGLRYHRVGENRIAELCDSQFSAYRQRRRVNNFGGVYPNNVNTE